MGKQMLFFCGVITINNVNFLVNPFTKIEGEPVLLGRDEYVQLTAEAYDFVTNVLDLEHREPQCKVYIECSPQEKNIFDRDDLKINEELNNESPEDKLDAYKEKCIRLMNEMISNQLMISNFELYHFFKLNHYLESKGFFITDENREEKYLEVINSGDAEALEKLSEYLDSLDEFNAIDDIYMRYKEFKDKVKVAKNEQEIKDAYIAMSKATF